MQPVPTNDVLLVAAQSPAQLPTRRSARTQVCRSRRGVQLVRPDWSAVDLATTWIRPDKQAAAGSHASDTYRLP